MPRSRLRPRVFAGLEARQITGVIPTKSLPRAPIRGRADPLEGPAQAVPPRRAPRHRPMPAGQDPAAEQREDRPRPVLRLQGAGLQRLRPRRAVPVAVACHQGGRHRPRLPRPPAGPTSARPLERAGRSAPSAPPLAVRRLPRRGQDPGRGLARAVRRGLDNMRIQAARAAAAITLKRLAAALLALICALLGLQSGPIRT